MVEYPANTPTCALGDFACPLGGTNADVLARDDCTLSDIACRVEGVQSNQIARTFSDTLGRCSSPFGGPFANVSGTAANVTARAALLGLGTRFGCFGGLRWLGLSVLAKGFLAAEGKGQRNNYEEWHRE